MRAEQAQAKRSAVERATATQRDREAQRAAERARRERERTDGAMASFEQVCETRSPSVVIARRSNGVTLLRCEVSDSA